MNERPVRILLVEDNPDDVDLALHALRKHNLANDIEVARDGAEALDRLFGTSDPKGDLPGIVLLDLKLPKVDGLEVLRRLKEDQMTRTIPVIVLTSSSDDRDLQRCYELGVNSYIVKPVDFEQFTEAVRVFGLYWILLNRTPDAPPP